MTVLLPSSQGGSSSPGSQNPCVPDAEGQPCRDALSPSHVTGDVRETEPSETTALACAQIVFLLDSKTFLCSVSLSWFCMEEQMSGVYTFEIIPLVPLHQTNVVKCTKVVESKTNAI